MKHLLLIALYLSSLSVLAEELIPISAQQLENLGVKLGKLTVVHSTPLMVVPAKVVVPIMNDHIVSTLYAGLLDSIKVNIGDKVKKGQVLATLNSPALLELQRQHLTSINEFELSEADFLRDKKLYKEKVISDRRWLKTRTSHQIVKSHVSETRQLLKISGFSQQKVQALENSHHLTAQLAIKSPISGVVLASKVKVGGRADALSPLFRVADTQTLWLEIEIPQQHIQKINIGDTVRFSGMEQSARIFLIGKNVHDVSQTVLVQAVIESASEPVKLGQILSVEVVSEHGQLMFQVLNTALTELDGQPALFLRKGTGFMLQPVTVLGRDGLTASIAGDFSQESVVAVKGVIALKANLLGLGGDE